MWIKPYSSRERNDILIAQVYVDDIVFGSTSKHLSKSFATCMSKEFEMSMVGELSFFLGLQIKQCEKGIFLSQTKYAHNILKKIGMNSSKHSNTPISTSVKLSLDYSRKDLGERQYRSMICNLLYLIASRLDLSFSVCVCAKYQSRPKESHAHAVKRILKYVSGTTDFGIWLSRDTNINVVGFSDADWVGCVDDRKSTSGGCFFIGNNLVAWHSKKQTSTSLSIAEAEYIAIGSCCTQLLWMKQMLSDWKLLHTAALDETNAI